MSDLSTGAKCVKYLLFVFNLLFLLAGLALIIVGSIVQYQTSHGEFGQTVSGVGIFIIVIGGIIFVIAFFGCAGAINNNTCMLITFGILLIVVLLAEVAAVIAGFVLKNKIEPLVQEQMVPTLQQYNANDPENLAKKAWDVTQQLGCCGTNNYTSWSNNTYWFGKNSVPDSCCQNMSTNCGNDLLHASDAEARKVLYTMGCVDFMVERIQRYMVAAGAVAAGVAILEIIGIIAAFCLVYALRKDYRVV